jgi:hypothetical protein
MEFVKIDSFELREDKNKRAYKVLNLSTNAKRTVTGTDGKPYILETPGKTCKVKSYEQTYLDDKKHWLYDLPVGSLLNGTIYTANVEPYIIEKEDDEGNLSQREVSTYTGFVLGFETDEGFETRVRRMILDNNRMPIESKVDADSKMQVAKEHQSLNEEVEIEETIEEEFGN